MQNNASSHKYDVTSFLVSEKEVIVNQPPYSPDLRLFLFIGLNNMLSEEKISPEVLLAMPYISASNRYQKNLLWVKRLQKIFW